MIAFFRLQIQILSVLMSAFRHPFAFQEEMFYQNLPVETRYPLGMVNRDAAIALEWKLLTYDLGISLFASIIIMMHSCTAYGSTIHGLKVRCVIILILLFRDSFASEDGCNVRFLY